MWNLLWRIYEGDMYAIVMGIAYIMMLAVIQKHDTKLEQIKLNKENPELELKMNSEERKEYNKNYLIVVVS